ncbi:solute carrier family 22 member 3-like [Battus philenor]|uniref:solute carrier family 22 member 3-like n=1 Tax=Battus philenor TaxID=42288 RepID=UPI0035D00180
MAKTKKKDIRNKHKNVIKDNNNVPKSVTDKHVDLDYVLVNELGQFGRFQFKNLLLVVLPIITSGFPGEYIFSAAAIPHRCEISECGENTTNAIYNPEWVTNAIPISSTGLSSCHRYASIYMNGSLDYCPSEIFDQGVITTCKNYVYERTDSVVYDFDLGCQEWMRALAGTLNSLGTLLVLPITGYFSDRYGRRWTLLVNTFNVGLFGVFRAFSVNYPMYLVLHLFQTAFGGGTFSTAFIFATELVGPKYRVLMSAILPSVLSLGLIILGGVAWAVNSWRVMILILHVPCFLIVSYYWLLGESVRWLLSKRKVEEARVILEEVAKVNETQISEKSMQSLLYLPSHVTPSRRNEDTIGLIKYIFRSPVLLRRVCTTPFLWLASTFVYYGFFINSTGLSDDVYLTFILTSAIDIPGNVAGIFFMAKIGRKISLVIGYFLSAACSIIFVFLPSDLDVLRLVMYLLGKFGIAMVLSGLYLYTSELYPTEHRHSLLAFSSMIGRIGSICAPLTPPLMLYWEGIPCMMFAMMGLIAGALVFTQPETLGTKLPDTLAEAEALGRTESKL